MTAITAFCGGADALGDAGVDQKVVSIERLYALMAIAQSALRPAKSGEDKSSVINVCRQNEVVKRALEVEGQDAVPVKFRNLLR